MASKSGVGGTHPVARASASSKALQQELRSLNKEPLEGFTIKLVNDNLFEWEVAIYGPPDTLYQGGYFKSSVKFPADYPYSPPSVRFHTRMWHPNIYENGDVCISILHPPVDDPTNSELPSEKWNPAQNVRTIMMSIISLLNEPNTSSPANVDASVMYRHYMESKGADKEYENIIKKQVAATRADAERDGVVVPLTLDDYCVKASSASTSAKSKDDNDYDDDGTNLINNDDYMIDDMDDMELFEDNEDDEDDNEEDEDGDGDGDDDVSNNDSGNDHS